LSRVNRLVGSYTERLEDLRLLRGRGRYVDDVSLPGGLFAVVLRSSFAHARITSIDFSGALARPGVVAVLTASDIPGDIPRIPLRLHPHENLEPFQQPVIASDTVRFVGEPIAMVLAESQALAEDALEDIIVETEELPVEALAEEAPVAIVYHGLRGEPKAAFEKADYVRRASFRIQRQAALPMETRGLAASWDSATGQLTVFGAAKVAFANRNILAAMLGLPQDAVELHELDVGGGFGSRGEFYPEDFLVPFAARHLGRPVKWTEDRREHLMAANHARDLRCEAAIACRVDGTILAMEATADVDVGAYVRTNGSVGPRNFAQALAGPYRVPDLQATSSLRITNKTPTGTYRGPGRYEADFVRERLFDIAARDLGFDQSEFRKLNLLRPDELPNPFPALDPIPQVTELDTGDYLETFERCKAEIAWDEKLPLQGKTQDGVYHGLGIGCFIEGGAVGPSEDARMVIGPDGMVAVYVGSSATGQGVETIMAQIAADALELPIERFAVFHGSTTDVRNGHGSYGSRATVMGGSAVLLAAEKLKEAIAQAAAIRTACASEAIRVSQGEAILPTGNKLTFADFSGLSVEATFYNGRNTYSYGAQAAHVTVDPRTGQVEVLDYVSVEDVGRIINALTLHGQTIGAIVQGLGGVFLEHVAYDEAAQIQIGSLAEYLVPTATDFPFIRSTALENYPANNNPLGAKGAGEGGIIPVAGVIANAVAAALSDFNVEPHTLPLSPQRVWELLREAADRSAESEH
jgi:carbon-monoxide dehydrogenase large subunit